MLDNTLTPVKPDRTKGETDENKKSLPCSTDILLTFCDVNAAINTNADHSPLYLIQSEKKSVIR